MIRKTLLAAATVASIGLAPLAHAAPVVVNVSTDAFDAGSLAGQTLTGQLSYDDATLDDTTAWLALSSFSFTVNAQTYTLAGTDLDNAVATFTDGLLTGVDAYISDALDFTFVSSFGPPFVYYQNGNDTGAANLSFRAETATVPEPASYALVLAALGGGLFARRRRQA